MPFSPPQARHWVGPGCVLLGTSVDPGELGLKYIVLDEPALQTELRREGFYFQWPWNTIIKYDVTWQSRTEKVDVLTADDLHVPTEVSVTYRVRPTELYAIHTQIGVNYYEDVVQAVFVTLVRDAFAQYSHNDLSREGARLSLLFLITFAERPPTSRLISIVSRSGTSTTISG